MPQFTNTIAAAVCAAMESDYIPADCWDACLTDDAQAFAHYRNGDVAWRAALIMAAKIKPNEILN